MDQRYKTAKLVIAGCEILGWVSTILGGCGVVLAFATAQNSPTSVELALLTSLLGIIGIAAAQMAKAQIDTAESTQELVLLTREQNSEIRSLLRASAASYAAPATMNRNASIKKIPTQVQTETYRGREIRYAPDGFTVGFMPFPTLDGAKEFIDRQEDASGAATVTDSRPS